MLRAMSITDESLLNRARDHAFDFLRTLPERHVGARATRAELLSALRVPLSRIGLLDVRPDPRILVSLTTRLLPWTRR